MTQAGSKPFTEFSFYVTAQIEKINSAINEHNNFEVKLDQINAQMKRLQNKFQEVDTKVKLLEVYQSQNFKNNQRLFNSQLTFDALDKKILILQHMQSEIISCAEEKMIVRNQQSQQRIYCLQKKMKEVESQLQRIRGRNVTLSKFRRDISPNVNCDSTKDISIDRKSNTNANQIKKVQIKIHQYINQRLKTFEKKFTSALHADRQRLFDFELTELENQSFLKNRLTDERQGQKQQSNVYQIKREEKKEKMGQNHFKNTIDSYYNQATQKQEIRDKAALKDKYSRGKNIVKLHNTSSRSKSKSKRKAKQHSAKKSISLKSVNQYLKLTAKDK